MVTFARIGIEVLIKKKRSKPWKRLGFISQKINAKDSPLMSFEKFLALKNLDLGSPLHQMLHLRI
jgi:hypothetical protein